MYRIIDADDSPKYAGRSRARVIDNRDPNNRGRIRVFHPILGETVWIEYLRTPGHFTVPSIGDVVYIESDSGDYQYPIAWGNITTGTNDSPNLPEEFRRDVPTNRGIFTPNGHTVELDDGVATLSNDLKDTNFTTESRGIRITSKAGNKVHIAEDTDSGIQHILLEDVNGNSVKLDYKDNKLSIVSKGTTDFNTTNDRTDIVGGNHTENISGNINKTIGGNLVIDVTGNVTINCSEATVNTSGNTNLTAGGNAVVQASQIELNGTASGITTANSHQNVIDLITGVPVIPSPTVKSDV